MTANNRIFRIFMLIAVSGTILVFASKNAVYAGSYKNTVLVIFMLLVFLASLNRSAGLLYMAVAVYPLFWLRHILLPDLGAGISMTEIILVILAASRLPSLAISRRIKFPPAYVTFFFFLFIATQVLSMVLNGTYDTGIRKTGRILLMGLSYITLISISADRHVEGITRWLMITFIVVNLLGLSQAILAYFGFAGHYYIVTEGIRRVSSSFFDPNMLAYFLITLLPLLFIQWCSGNGKKGTVFIFGSIVMLLTFSRGGWIGLAAGLFFSFIMISFRGLFKVSMRRRAVVLLAGAMLVLVAMVSLFPAYQDTLYERMENLTDFKSGSGRVRRDIWETSLALLAAHPVIGIGPGISLSYMRQQNLSRFMIHNSLLEIAVETGYFGLIAFLALFFSIIYMTTRKLPLLLANLGRDDRGLYVGMLAGMAACFVQSFTLSNVLYDQKFVFLLYVLYLLRSRSAMSPAHPPDKSSSAAASTDPVSTDSMQPPRLQPYS